MKVVPLYKATGELMALVSAEPEDMESTFCSDAMRKDGFSRAKMIYPKTHIGSRLIKTTAEYWKPVELKEFIEKHWQELL